MIKRHLIIEINEHRFVYEWMRGDVMTLIDHVRNVQFRDVELGLSQPCIAGIVGRLKEAESIACFHEMFLSNLASGIGLPSIFPNNK